jgi:hypothetical protein
MSLDTELSVPMGWKLFLLDRAVTNDEIASTFAEIFDIDRSYILVTKSQEEIDFIISQQISLISCPYI